MKFQQSIVHSQMKLISNPLKTATNTIKNKEPLDMINWTIIVHSGCKKLKNHFAVEMVSVNWKLEEWLTWTEKCTQKIWESILWEWTQNKLIEIEKTSWSNFQPWSFNPLQHGAWCDLIPKLETNQKPKSSMLSSTQFELNINDAIFSEIDIKLRKNKSNKKLRKKTNCIPSSCYRYDSLPWIGRRVQKVLGVIRERERERVTN